MKAVNALALILVIVGALNWGLVAIAKFDLVAEIFGEEFGTTNRGVVSGALGRPEFARNESAPIRGRSMISIGIGSSSRYFPARHQFPGHGPRRTP